MMGHASVVPAGNLSDLAETAVREHGLALQAGESMLLHAVRAGEALLEARNQVADGEWGKWLEGNFPASDRTAKQYMRIARGKELVLTSEAKTLTAAERLVPALSPGLHRQRPNVEAEEEEAREMYKGGATFNAIADHFGIAHMTAKSWVIPGFRAERNKRLRDERRVVREVKSRRATRAALRRAGAAMSELYASCERLQDVFGQARDEVGDPAARQRLAAAEHHYRQMRDEVVRALGTAGSGRG